MELTATEDHENDGEYAHDDEGNDDLGGPGFVRGEVFVIALLLVAEVPLQVVGQRQVQIRVPT